MRNLARKCRSTRSAGRASGSGWVVLNFLPRKTPCTILGQGLSALSGRSCARDTHDVSYTWHATDRPVTSAAPQDGPGFAVAVTEAQHGTVRVHLIGQLEASTARILTAAFAALHERPGEQDVVLDLSALTFIDRIGMSVLGVNRALLDASGWAVSSAHPHGADLRLLDCAAWAGWAPPHLECTNILHWKPRLLAQERPSR